MWVFGLWVWAFFMWDPLVLLNFEIRACLVADRERERASSGFLFLVFFFLCVRERGDAGDFGRRRSGDSGRRHGGDSGRRRDGVAGDLLRSFSSEFLLFLLYFLSISCAWFVMSVACKRRSNHVVCCVDGSISFPWICSCFCVLRMMSSCFLIFDS